MRVGAAGVLIVDGGTLNGLEPGAVIAVHAPETVDFHTADAPWVEAMVDSATATSSTARRTDSTQPVADRSRARLLRPSTSERPISVRLVDVPDGVSAAAAAVPDESRFFTLTNVREAAKAEPAHVEVRSWKGEVPPVVWPGEVAESWKEARDGWVLLAMDLFGAPSVRSPDSAREIIAYLPGAGPLIEGLEEREHTLGQALGRGLATWSRYLSARDRRSQDDTLSTTLAVKLRAGDGEAPRSQGEADGITALAPVDGVYTVTPSQWVLVEVKVLMWTSLPLHIGLVAFSDGGSIVSLWPPEGMEPTLAPGDVLQLGLDRFTPLQFSPRSDQDVSRWLLKLVACTTPPGADPINFRSLEQPAVQDVISASIAPPKRRGGGIRRWINPAEKAAWYAWTLRIDVRCNDQ